MDVEQQGRRFNALLKLNPHLAAKIAEGSLQGQCLEELLDRLAACTTAQEVQAIKDQLPSVHFGDSGMGIGAQFV